MPDDKVTVVESAPVRVSRGKAVRIWLGRFILDYLETFSGLIPGQLLALVVTPQLHFSSVEEAKIFAMQVVIQLGSPAFAALISAGRRSGMSAWPAIKKFLENGFS